MILTYNQILEHVRQNALITNFIESNLEGASYDMRLGAEFAKHGKKAFLTENEPSLRVLPGEFVLLTTFERLNVPKNMVGHNGIMSSWAKLGIVSLFSPQIDPGFVGVLIVPIYNAGDAPVSMSLKQKIFTVEFQFSYMMEPAPTGWSERYGPQDGIGHLNTPSSSKPFTPEIGELREDLKRMTEKLSNVANSSVQSSADIKVLVGRVDAIENAKRTRLSRFALLVSAASLTAVVTTLVINNWHLISKLWGTPGQTEVEPSGRGVPSDATKLKTEPPVPKR